MRNRRSAIIPVAIVGTIAAASLALRMASSVTPLVIIEFLPVGILLGISGAVVISRPKNVSGRCLFLLVTVGIVEGHVGQHLLLTPGESGQWRFPLSHRSRDQRVHNVRIDHRPAGDDRLHGGQQLRGIVDRLFQHIGVTRGAVPQIVEDISLIDILAENDYPDGRVGAPEPRRGLNSLVGGSGRHANVGDHHVRRGGVDGGQEGAQIVALVDDFKLRLGFHDGTQPAADKEAVVSQDEPDHRATLPNEACSGGYDA